MILIDGNSTSLTQIAALDADQIETLTIPDFQSDMTDLLKDAWGDEPLSMVVNLMPLAFPVAITAQMRTLAAILRTTARGLVAANGSIVSVVARPRAPLDLVGQGRIASMSAGSKALGEAMNKHGVRAHVLSVPNNKRSLAISCLLKLHDPTTPDIASTTFNLN